MRDIKSTLASVRKKFSDNISLRSNTTGGLGTATDGSKWTAINGTINVSTGKATATAPAANATGDAYPIATVTMPTTNNVIEIADTGQGAAAALWVQSSTDWWMVDIDSTFNTIPGNTTYGAVGSNYSTAGSNYGKVGDNYGVVGANYQAVGSNYVTVNSNYGKTGDNYGAVGTNYVTNGTNYGAVGTNYGAVGSNYGATGSNYNASTSYTSSTSTNLNWSSSSGSNANYSVNYRSAVVNKVTNYFATYSVAGYSAWTNYSSAFSSSTSYTAKTNYGVGTANYGVTGSNFGATGSNYGAVGSNYSITGSNYGDTGDNFGVVGANYVTTGTNYGTLNSNYGDTGDNFGIVGSNYVTVNSNYGTTGTNATTYAYAQYIRIKQSSAGIVSTITSALISASQTINSLRIQLSGNQITAKGYSDSNFVTQVGSDLVHTATGAVVTTNFGIAISPSAYQQSDIIGSSINITRV